MNVVYFLMIWSTTHVFEEVDLHYIYEMNSIQQCIEAQHYYNQYAPGYLAGCGTLTLELEQG